MRAVDQDSVVPVCGYSPPALSGLFLRIAYWPNINYLQLATVWYKLPTTRSQQFDLVVNIFRGIDL